MEWLKVLQESGGGVLVAASGEWWGVLVAVGGDLSLVG